MLGGETLKITYASRAADGRADGRPAGLRQDHQLGQAGPLVQGARAASRCSSAPTSSARPPSSSCARSAARSTCRCSASPAIRSRPPSRGLEEARRLGRDVLIVDTAGRLAIDAEMMEQVRQISERRRSPTTRSSSSTR